MWFRMFENPEWFEVQLFLLVVVVIGFVVWRALRERGTRRTGTAPANEDELVDRLAQQVDRMERRLENLETILADKHRPK